jgi:hypothetical protein
MRVSWVDDGGQARTLEVEAAYAEAAGRVFESDYGFRHVRVGGRPPSAPATEVDRHLFGSWERGEHLGEHAAGTGPPQEGGPDGP